MQDQQHHDHTARFNQFSREDEIRIHALNIAAAQRREIVRFKETEELGELARTTLADAQLYAKWLATGAVD